MVGDLDEPQDPACFQSKFWEHAGSLGFQPALIFPTSFLKLRYRKPFIYTSGSIHGETQGDGYWT
jgi:hypothetical protein